MTHLPKWDLRFSACVDSMDDICCCAVDGNLFYCVCQDEAGWERSEDWVWDLRETQNNMENMRNKWHKIVDKVVPGQYPFRHLFLLAI